MEDFLRPDTLGTGVDDLLEEGAMPTASVRIVSYLDKEGLERIALAVSEDTSYSHAMGLLHQADYVLSHAWANKAEFEENDGD